MRRRRTIHRTPGEVCGLAFSGDGRRLAVSWRGGSLPIAGLDQVLGSSWSQRLTPKIRRTTILDVATGRREATLPYAEHFSFASDGQTLITYLPESDAIQSWSIPPQTALPVATWPAFAAALFLSGAWWYARRKRAAVQP